MSDVPTYFPENIVAILAEYLAEIEGVEDVVTRPIRTSDPDGTAGVFAGEWTPEEYEIGVQSGEPTIQNYSLFLQFTSKLAGEEQENRGLHAVVSRKIRAMLYRNPDLHVALRGLSEALDGATERFARMETQRQRFFSNQAQGVFLFLSVLDLKVQTTV